MISPDHLRRMKTARQQRDDRRRQYVEIIRASIDPCIADLKAAFVRLQKHGTKPDQRELDRAIARLERWQKDNPKP